MISLATKFVTMTSYNYYQLGAGVGFSGATQGYPFPAGGAQATVSHLLSQNQLAAGLNQNYQPHVTQASSTQSTQSNDDLEFLNLELKILSPHNKKDYRIYTLRHVSRDLDSPDKLKDVIYQQCKEAVPLPQHMEIGFFQHSKKLWINNRLDVNDMWAVAAKGGKVMLWCVGIGENNHGSQKRSREDTDSNEKESEPACKRNTSSVSSIDALKICANESELKLKTKHGDTYTPFQYKLWAEMYAKGAWTQNL